MIRTLRSALGGAASAAVLVLSLALASCDSPSGPTPAGTTAHLEIIAGDGQTGVAGKELGAPLVVKVTDDKGKAVKGQVVNFRVVAGNGTVFGSTALTSADGLAQERWTLGTTARDTQKVEARAVDPATGTAIVFATFTAVATPDVPAALTKVVGDGQSAPVGAPLPDSLAVKLADRYGNAVAGQTVTFAVVSGGGSVSPASRSTDSAGVARAQWTLGTRLDSAQVASASFGSLPPVTFTAAATVSGTLTRFGGDGQTGVVAHRLADSLAVRLTTGGGAPVRGATIQWTTAAGALIPATSVTDANGVARTSWLLGTAAGAQAAQAAVVGGTQTIGFTATGTADAPDHLVRIGGDGLTAPAGGVVADSLAVQALDAYGNAVRGMAITWTSPRGGGSFSPPTSTTAANGVAKTQWTLGARLDSAQVARATAGSLAPVEWTATAGTGTLLIEKASGDAQSAPVHTALPQPLVVTIRLADGRPVAGAQVQWQIVSDPGDPAQPATLSAPYTVTDAAGQTSVQWTLGTAAGPRSVRAKAQSGAEVIFTATGTSGAAEQLQIVGSAQRAGDLGSAVADSLAVRAFDHFGNGVPGMAITWSSPRGGGSFSPPVSLTGADGVAKTQWTLGARLDSAQVARATLGSLAPVEWAATAASGALQIEKTSGDAQTAAVHTTLPRPLVVTVRLGDGRPVAGAQVQWQIVADAGDPAQPGSLSASSSVTDAAGQASVQWTIGTAVGSRTAKATVQGGAEVIFTASGAAGPAETLEAVGSTTPTADVETAIADSLAVRALDHYGNGVPGVAVGWAVTLGGGTISPATSPTDAGGVARAQWTLGSRAGVGHAARAKLGTLPVVPFRATATAPATAVLEKTSGDAQSGVVGAALGQPLMVTVRLADGRPLVGATLAWAIAHDSTTNTTGRLTSATTVTDSAGRATATWLLGTFAEAKQVQVSLVGTPVSAVFDAAGVADVPRTLTNTPPPTSAPAGSTLPIVSRVVDRFGNPRPGTWVRFAVVEGSGTMSPDSALTDSTGVARGQWTLGGSGGIQQLSVTAEALVSPRIQVTATAPVTVAITAPRVDQLVSSMNVEVDVTAVNVVDSVWAVVADRRVRLTAYGASHHEGELTLLGLPSGPITLQVFADVAGTGIFSTSRRIIHNAVPIVSVTSPAPQALVQGGMMHVAASCTDDGPTGCKSLIVQIGVGTFPQQVASGIATVDAMVPVSSYDGRTITVRFVGTDANGFSTNVDRVVSIEGSAHVNVQNRVPGQPLDANTARILYLDSAGALVVRDRSTGTDTQVAAAGLHAQVGFLSPAGAIFVGKPAATLFVYDWRGGGALSAGAPPVSSGALSNAGSLLATGGWAVWSENNPLVRRDLSAGTNLVVSANAHSIDVAENGDVVYVDPAITIHRYRAGVDTVVSPIVGRTGPVTDGNLIVFQSPPPTSTEAFPPRYLYVYDPAVGVVTLTTAAPYSFVVPNRDYRVEGGWVAYMVLGTRDQAEVWRRSPAGVVERVSFLSASSTMEGLGPDGSVLYVNSSRRYLAVPGSASVDVGVVSAGDRAVWVNGRFWVFRTTGYVLEIVP